MVIKEHLKVKYMRSELEVVVGLNILKTVWIERKKSPS
nr:MAG TPA: hypothetical protein [Caudoviricetes sp.]